MLLMSGSMSESSLVKVSGRIKQNWFQIARLMKLLLIVLETQAAMFACAFFFVGKCVIFCI